MSLCKESLRILLAREQGDIDLEVKRAEYCLEEITREIGRLHDIPFAERRPEERARLAHLGMLQARELVRLGAKAPEIEIFYVAQAAEDISQFCQYTASQTGELAKFSRMMNHIERREFGKANEFYLTEEAPADYAALDARYGELSEKIGETVFVSILQKYRLPEFADRFEKDRRGFEIDREIGRRFVMRRRGGPEDLNEKLDALYRDDYGDSALAHIIARTCELIRKFGNHRKVS